MSSVADKATTARRPRDARASRAVLLTAAGAVSSELIPMIDALGSA